MASGSLNFSIVLRAVDQLSAPLAKIAGAIANVERAAAAAHRLREMGGHLQEMGAKATAAGAAMGLAALPAIKSFADQEQALTRLKVAFMEEGGKTSPFFDAVMKQAVQLGNELPGTTADFAIMAQTLREGGISADKVAGAIFSATAHMKALMPELSSKEAAQHMVTFQESLGVAEHDFEKFVDVVQRGKFAFGIEPGSMAYTLGYIGPLISQLGVGGLEGSKSFYILSGMLSQAGISGEKLGTTLRETMTHIPDLQHKLTGKVGAEIAGILKGAGVELEFFKNGKFMGLENLTVQLEKLRGLNDQDKLRVLKHLFGENAMTALAVLVKGGVAGYNAAAEKFQKQAALGQRAKEMLATLSSKWETATGNIENMLASLGGVFAGEMKDVVDRLADVAAATGAWIEANGELIKPLGLAIAATSALAVGLGAAGLVAGTLMRGVAATLVPLSMLARGMVAVTGGSVRLATGLARLAGRGLQLLALGGGSAARGLAGALAHTMGAMTRWAWTAVAASARGMAAWARAGAGAAFGALRSLGAALAASGATMTRWAWTAVAASARGMAAWARAGAGAAFGALRSLGAALAASGATMTRWAWTAGAASARGMAAWAGGGTGAALSTAAQGMSRALMLAQMRMGLAAGAIRLRLLELPGAAMAGIRAFAAWARASVASAARGMAAWARAGASAALDGLRSLSRALSGGIAAMGRWMGASIAAAARGMAAWARGGMLAAADGVRGLTRSLWAGVRAMGAWAWAALPTRAALVRLATAPFSAIAGGFRVVIGAVRGMTMALLSNPVVLGAMAIAAGAVLIYKYWAPIAGFFTGLWRGFRSTLAPLAPAIDRIAGLAGRFVPFSGVLQRVAGWFARLWDWAMRLIAPVDDVGHAAERLGERWGQALAGVVATVAALPGRLLSALSGLPTLFVDLGRQLMAGLKNGIVSAAGAVVDTVAGVGSSIAGGFKGLLGIHSPSRVFAGFGGNIMDGLSLGILGKVGEAADAVARVGQAIQKPAAAFALPAAVMMMAAPAMANAPKMAAPGLSPPALASPAGMASPAMASPGLASPALLRAAAGQHAAGGAGPAAGGPVSVSLTVNVQGGGGAADGRAVAEAVKAQIPDIVRAMREEQHRQSRTGY
jgi:TP901 family phage tail tape measure protein